MIKQETAEKIVDVCEEIDVCQQTLTRLDNVKKKDYLYIFLSVDINGDTNHILISLLQAKGVIMSQLDFLKSEYDALNKKAVMEGSK